MLFKVIYPNNACVGGAQGPNVLRSQGPWDPGAKGPRGPRAQGPQGPKVPRSQGPRGPGTQGPRVPNQTTLTHEGFLNFRIYCCLGSTPVSLYLRTLLLSLLVEHSGPMVTNLFGKERGSEVRFEPADSVDLGIN